MSDPKNFDISCPIPLSDHRHIKLAHGGGGRLMQRLIDDIFLTAFDNPTLKAGHDGALLNPPAGRLVMTTDSYVVQPLFFPGGDIGSLAINGTVNDLAMCGAKPLYLSASFILEEGLPIETLWRVVQSIRKAADATNIHIVTGDTKVVQRGHGDGIYINTTGIGIKETDIHIHPQQIKPGDKILINGDIARHGMAVISAREELQFSTSIESDCAPLWEVVNAMLKAGIQVHCLRDATRGGLAAVLNELAQQSGLQFNLRENDIPVADHVRGACEVLGFDTLHIACEGRFVAVVDSGQVEEALMVLRLCGDFSGVIGEVSEGESGLVVLETAIGGERVLDMPVGELLPRIC